MRLFKNTTLLILLISQIAFGSGFWGPITQTGGSGGSGTDDSAIWGNITGLIANQSDLQTALEAKADEISPTLFVSANFDYAGASTVAYFNGLKNLVSSNTTIEQLNRLDATSSIQTQLDGKVNLTGSVNETITGVKTFSSLPESSISPTTGNQLVNKTYADGLQAGFLYNTPVVAATAAALAANTYNNGASGVGATLTGNANGSVSPIDGFAVVAGDRILIKNEATAANNGVYTITTVGDGSNPYVLTRATDLDASADISQGDTVFVQNGSTLDGSAWSMTTAGVITVGTTAQSWVQVSRIPTAGTGLVQNGNAFDVDIVDNDGLKFSGGDLTLAYDNSTLGINSGSSTLEIKTTGVAAATYGSVSTAPQFTVNSRGQLTAASTNPIREVLAGTRNYYVRTDGSDSNTCLVNTAGGACLTIQRAVNLVSALDINTRTVNINVADGTYTGAIVASGPWLGSGTVSIIGNTATPANVIINVNNLFAAIRVINGASLTLSGMEIRTNGAGQGVRVESSGYVTIGASMRFGTVVNSQIYTETNGNVFGRSAYSIVGSAQSHLEAVTSSAIDLAGITVTLTGTPAFSTAFATASRNGVVQVNANTYSGSATGTRYVAATNGVIFTNGGGATYLPGNAAGSTSSGGQYQ